MRTLVSLAVPCSILLACQSDEPVPDLGSIDSGVTVEPIRVLDPDEDYAGKSLEEWAIEYMRWSNSSADCANAANDEDGSRCALYQEESDSPVFFFERSSFSRSDPKTTERTKCDLPANKAILVPISLVYVDNGGAPMPRSVEELYEQADQVKASMRNMRLRVDGEEIRDIDTRGVGPVEFEYHVPAEPNIFSCDGYKGVAETTIKPSFVAGYLAILAPPPPGEHEVEYTGVFTFANAPFATAVKHTFTIEKAAD